MNRKRSHDDLEDADECLPISKRINSLHLEGKAHGMCHSHRQHHQVNGFPNNNPVTIISPLASDGIGGSALPFHNHQQQNNLPLIHNQNEIGDKCQAFPSIPTDYNCNIASSSHMPIPPTHSYSQSHQPSPQNVYNDDALHAMISTDRIMFNVNDGVHHSGNNNTHQSFPCNSNHHHHHHHQHLDIHQQQNQNHQNLHSIFPPQSAASFANNTMPMSSCPNGSLVNSHYASSHAGVSHHSNAAASATNLNHGQQQPHHQPVLEEDLPSGPYDPELGMAENPHYYSNNKLLYEAHLSRLQRIVPDYQLHS